MDQASQRSCDPSNLCDEIRFDPIDSEYRVIHGREAPRRIVAESANFVVLADFAPIVLGHSLLVPRTHYFSFAELSDDLTHEALELIDNVRSALDPLGSLQIAEHGSAPGSTKSACITHAHWHLLPGVPDIVVLLQQHGVDGVWIDRVSALATHVRPQQPYYLVGSDKGYWVARDIPTNESQVVRKTLYAALGRPDGEYDWALHQDKAALIETISLYRSEL